MAGESAYRRLILPILCPSNANFTQQQSLEIALAMMHADDAARKRQADEDASSRALAEALLQEEKEFQRRAQLEEEATRTLLAKEREARQLELDLKEYPCRICFTDYTIDKMYTLDDCSHRCASFARLSSSMLSATSLPVPAASASSVSKVTLNLESRRERWIAFDVRQTARIC